MTFAASLLFPGVIIKTKAKMEGRKGPGLLQPLFDIGRSLRKGSVYSPTTSVIFKMAPVVYLASILVATLFVPFGNSPGFLSFDGDFIFFACILSIGRFIMIIGAMDTGSGFEGMGANREALYSMIVEPAFFVVMGSMSLIAGATSFHKIFLGVYAGSNLAYLLVIVCVFLLLQILLVENSRMPVDDPKTHLELTMIHEVMVLDNSGFDLGLINYAAALKFALYGSLIANFIMPASAPMLVQVGMFLLVPMGCAVIIGTYESFRARNKVAKNPQWILTLSAISLIVFLAALILSHKITLS